MTWIQKTSERFLAKSQARTMAPMPGGFYRWLDAGKYEGVIDYKDLPFDAASNTAPVGAFVAAVAKNGAVLAVIMGAHTSGCFFHDEADGPRDTKAIARPSRPGFTIGSGCWPTNVAELSADQWIAIAGTGTERPRATITECALREAALMVETRLAWMTRRLAEGVAVADLPFPSFVPAGALPGGPAGLIEEARP